MNIQPFKTSYQIVKFALPIIVSILVNMLASFLSLWLIADCGHLALAAAALAVTTHMTIMATFAMMLYAIGILIGHSHASVHDTTLIGQIIRNGLWLALMLSIPASLLLWISPNILLIFKQNPQVVALTSRYFHFAILSTFAALMGAVIAQFFLGIGRSKFMLISSLINLPISFTLSYGFILGHFNLPRLGLAGVSCATFFTQTLVSLAMVAYIIFHKEFIKYHVFSTPFWPNWNIIKKIFTLGLPIGLQFGGEFLAMTLSTYLMGFFGVISLSANQVVSQFTMLIVIVALGLSQGISVLISAAFANQDGKLIESYFSAIMIIVSGIFVVIFPLFCLFPKVLMALYLPAKSLTNPYFVDLLKQLFIIASIFILMDSFRNMLCAGLRGLHDTKTPMHISVACLWFISLPVSILAAFVFHGGPAALRAGFISGYAIASILLWSRMHNLVKTCQSRHINTGRLNSQKDWLINEGEISEH